MKFPVHLPYFPVDSPVAVIKPLYAKLRHVRKFTLLPAVLLFGVGTGLFIQPDVRTPRVFQKAGRFIQDLGKFCKFLTDCKSCFNVLFEFTIFAFEFNISV
jgi:hypothetical protein